MSQYSFDIDVADSGTELVAQLDGFRDALLSAHSAATRPAYAVEGTVWLKDVSSTVKELYIYDGDTDLLILTFNPTTNSRALNANTIDGYSIGSLNRIHVGAAAPTPTQALMLWGDTSAGYLKQRKSDDSGWVVLGVLNSPGLMLTNAGDPNGVVTGSYAGQQLYDSTNGVLYLYSGTTTVWVIANQKIITPPGIIAWHGKNTAPVGWLKCNGAAISRTVYAALWNEIGTTFGVGDGSTTFNIPDLRADFIRGWDDSRGVDSGRVFGSFQAHALQEHSHFVGSGIGGTTTSGNRYAGNSAQESGPVRNANAASETRPRNTALLPIIKF